MNKKKVVVVENISKIYRLYNKPFDRVKEALNPFKKKYHKSFYALNNVSLTLNRGEALGIIGKNGSGKSTLLKIISKVLTPTSGKVKSYGRISAILELTSNLKPEMTGRQNIIYNLKIQGFTSKKEIEDKTKEIEDFAEIGDFIDQPVKVYSSGMKSRLGFGIATSVEPDILILDEVLAVGDFEFQQKCLAKINSMRDRISMIFVSHSMNSVRLFCDNVLVLQKGKKTFYGKAEDGIKYYLEQEEKKKKELKKKEKKKETEESIKPFYGDLFHNKNKVIEIEHYWINEKYEIINNAKSGEKTGIYIKFKLSYKPIDLVIGLPIWDIHGNYITGISTEMDNYKVVSKQDNIYEIYFMFDNILNPNKYINVISIVDKTEILYRAKNSILEVFPNRSRYFGFVSIPHIWIQSKIKKIFEFNNIKLYVDVFDKGGLSYDSKSSYEEINNRLYKEIKDRYSPDIIIDVGANYGFISVVLSRLFNNPKIIMVEASEKLIDYIHYNMKINEIKNYKLYNAICAEVSKEIRKFSYNPFGSQDNRVIGENKNWKTKEHETVSLNDIISENDGKFYFIKIDTQGYEPNVFKGGESFLKNNNNWIIKTEFAPYWIKSQGFEPNSFLEYLIENYTVCESPNRTKFKGESIESLLNNKLDKTDINNFINYIIKHNKNERGWCDLYIFPKNLNGGFNE